MAGASRLFQTSASLASSPIQAPSGLVPATNYPKQLRPWGNPDLVLSSQGKVYTPEGLFIQSGDPVRSSINYDVDTDEEYEMPAEEAVDYTSQHWQKKARQSQKWAEEIIPMLIEPYVALLRQTNSLRTIDECRTSDHCKGCANGSKLTVMCIYFNQIEKVVLCTCQEPALQLLSRGLFPCAPTRPSLAVDLNMLDFARELFVNSAPNITAWCHTLEGFLSARQFKLATRDSLRGRFGNALHWYALLVDTKNVRLREYLNAVRENLVTIQSEPGLEPEIKAQESSPPSDPTNNPEMQDRPSEYLRERCPLCFGGRNWAKPNDLVDAIVCLDACFTQKRKKTRGNQAPFPRTHPESVFVPEEETSAMETVVEAAWPSKPARRAKAADLAVDGYEPGMQVPTLVLDGCNESFTAADDNCVKASTQFFADTGLMAMLCRHDRVLWLVNMKSAGEKQFYALTLLQKLFRNVPASMRLGCLYDIGCQLHRSCVKFGFLDGFLDRIVFGISVFHAYGHQWPCQIIYHPRKCVGFGQTDGEGCERFWSAIKPLIPSLRSSGPYTRIYALDTQVKHLDAKSCLGLGRWLRTKWISAESKERSTTAILDKVYATGVTESQLRTEWDAQVLEQTKPLARQSKHLADKQIQEILALTKTLDEIKLECEKYDAMLLDGSDSTLSAEEIQDLLAALSAKKAKYQTTISNKKKKLTGARAPIPIVLDGLFKLNVDDDIWQDIGLHDDNDQTVIPDWLGNDIVRKGIKALLEHDRCLEEKRQLIAECASMQDWVFEEWEVSAAAMVHVSSDANLTFLLQERQHYLLRLCAHWVPAVDIIPAGLFAEWGPSSEDIRRAATSEVIDSALEYEEEQEDLSEDDDLANAEVFADVEALRLADAYHELL